MSLCCADGVSALSAASSVVFSSPTVTLSSTGTVILLPLVRLDVYRRRRHGRSM